MKKPALKTGFAFRIPLPVSLFISITSTLPVVEAGIEPAWDKSHRIFPTCLPVPTFHRPVIFQ